MEIDALHSKFAGVNGTKTKSLRYRLVKRLTSQKRAEQGIFLTRLSKSIIGILSDDFATVDVREELCYHSRPKKRKFRGQFGISKNSGYFKPEKKIPSQNSLPLTNKFDWVSFGGLSGTRTLGPLIKSQLLYQLSYWSKFGY